MSEPGEPVVACDVSTGAKKDYKYEMWRGAKGVSIHVQGDERDTVLEDFFVLVEATSGIPGYAEPSDTKELRGSSYKQAKTRKAIFGGMIDSIKKVVEEETNGNK
jgi:hypothetical protein